MEYVYSATNNSFYPVDMKYDYVAAGSWPTDGIEVSEKVFKKYVLNSPPDGKVRGAGDDGLPAWIDIPPLTKKENIAKADDNKKALMNEVDSTSRAWQTQLMLGIISDEDKASLTAWMKYYKKLQSVDTSKAPDISWPDKPA